MGTEIRQDLCILVSTCDRYMPVARWTIELLESRWNPAPPMYICGATSADSLPLKCNPRDWMTITVDAIKHLRERGHRWVYLILDDHPPMGMCDTRHLNETIPGMADKLDASNIGLLGYRNHGNMEGIELGREYYHIERSSPEYPWRFSLHPALWSLERLQNLLEIRIDHTTVEERTPWNFEKFLDADYGPIPEIFLSSTYRICGAQMTNRAAFWGYETILAMLAIVRGTGERLGGKRFLREFDTRFLGFQHYYRGPYPIFWSGVVHKGGPSLLLRNFLYYSGQRKMLGELERVGKAFLNSRADQSLIAP